MSTLGTLKPTMEIRQCPICGTSFPASNKRGREQVYCSKKCRYQAKYRREKHEKERNRGAVQDNRTLMKNVDEQERYIMWQRDQINRLETRNKEYLGYLRKISNDLAALVDAGIVRVDQSAADPRLLARHGGIIPIMEKFEDREESPLERQERRFKEMQQRHRDELDQAKREGRNELYLNAIFRRQNKETRRVREECSAWIAWHELQEKRKELRDQYGVDYLPYQPGNIIEDEGKSSRKDNDHDTGRQENSRARSTAQGGEGREGADQEQAETPRQDRRDDQESLQGIPGPLRRNPQEIRVDGGHGEQARHQTSLDHDAGNRSQPQHGTATPTGAGDADSHSNSTGSRPDDNILTSIKGGDVR